MKRKPRITRKPRVKSKKKSRRGNVKCRHRYPDGSKCNNWAVYGERYCRHHGGTVVSVDNVESMIKKGSNSTFFSTLSDKEQEMWLRTFTDQAAALEEEVRLTTIRELRYLKRIEKLDQYSFVLYEKETEWANTDKKNKNNGGMLVSHKEREHSTMHEILKLEEQLTKVQGLKAKQLKDLQHIRYQQALLAKAIQGPNTKRRVGVEAYIPGTAIGIGKGVKVPVIGAAHAAGLLGNNNSAALNGAIAMNGAMNAMNGDRATTMNGDEGGVNQNQSSGEDYPHMYDVLPADATLAERAAVGSMMYRVVMEESPGILEALTKEMMKKGLVDEN